MTRAIVLGTVVVLGALISIGQNKPETSSQADRGRLLFEKSPKGLPCATCHSLEGLGTEVGPDLRRLAAIVSPRDLLRTIDMQRTVFVQEVRTTDGRAFPGIQEQIRGDTMDIWDLSLTPPLLRSIKTSAIASMKENVTWGHPPASADYKPQELADIIGFVKYAATGTHREVATSDLK